MEALHGILEKIVFENPENGFVVARVRQDKKKELATIVGNLGSVQVGETLSLEGEWENNKKFGPQFKITKFEVIPPSTLFGIEKYLGSGLVKGIGPVMAQRIVEKFGLETLDVLENHPLLLTRVEGLGRKRVKQIKIAWDEQREMREVMIFLQGHGVSPTYAIKIYKAYGKKAITQVQENPYRLAADIFGIGFLTADRIARNLGVDLNSPMRGRAGLVHVMNQFSEEGHVYAPEATLIEQAETILKMDIRVLEEALAELYKHEELIPDTDDLGERIVYLKPLFLAESGVAEMLRKLREGGNTLPPIDVEKAIAWAEEREQITLAPLQREAVRKALQSKVMVITGGPGTGKTTIINTILMILKQKKIKFRLAAPTGRATKRMREATGEEAETLHRLLEFHPQTARFARTKENPLEGEIFIVDEASMIDIVLAFYFFKALPPTAHLILVGDVDQLPSVGPGNVLNDIIQSKIAEVVELREIFRQAEKSLTIVNAHRINLGEMPILKKPEGDEIPDFYFIEKEEPKEIAETIRKLVVEKIPARFQMDPFEEIQVLAPMYRGETGVDELNRLLQEALNPSTNHTVRGDRAFHEGDKVMQVRNNYDKGVFNGDIGRIFQVDQEEQEVAVDFLGTIVRYDFSELDELVLGYACSVHKSQGSEFRAVVIALTTQHYILLQRNLLYTAITRGKELVVLVGSLKALSTAIRNNKIKYRYSNLKSRLLL